MNRKYSIGSDAKKRSEGISLPAISKIVLVVDEENAFEAGDDTGYALEVYCPYGTQQMANDLLEQASGFVYTGYSAESVQLPPEAELGDGVVIGNTYGMLASRKFSFTPKLTENISAPLEKEVEHEYSYEGTLTKEVKRKLTLGASYYGTSITRQRGLEIKHYDALGNPTTRVTLNSETLAFYNANGNKAFYYDSTTGEFKISSSIVVGLDEYEKKAELSTDISTYIDSAAGTAKIVSACSATYLSKTSAADQYETITAAAQIAQSVSDVQSEISLSADFGSGTVGSNVRALLQLVSNADTSSIEIKADKINFTGVTTFVRPGDNISTLNNNADYQTSSGVTTIIGDTVTTGYIEALNIQVKAANITGKLTASQINADGISASNVTISGAITATSGSMQNMTITGKLTFGGNSSYYINANYNDGSYYINLPGFKVDDASGAIFSGKLEAASGTFTGSLTSATGSFKGKVSFGDETYYIDASAENDFVNLPGFSITDSAGVVINRGNIGGFNVGSSTMSYIQNAYNGGNPGVYIGTDGIGLGGGKFYVVGNSGDVVASTINLLSSDSNASWTIGASGIWASDDSYVLSISTDSLHASSPDDGGTTTWVDVVGAGNNYANSTSDARLKKDIELLPEQYDSLFDEFKPVRYKYVNGTSGRYHTGFVVQDIIEALSQAGLTTADFAAICLSAEGTPNEKWMLRRDELVALNTWQIQKLKARVAALEDIVTKLQEG